MQLFNDLKTVLAPKSFKEKVLQVFLALTASGLSFFIPNPLGGYGLPVKFYSPDVATCTSIGCPSSEPIFFSAEFLIVNIVFWYLIGELILRLIKRWKN